MLIPCTSITRKIMWNLLTKCNRFLLLFIPTRQSFLYDLIDSHAKGINEMDIQDDFICNGGLLSPPTRGIYVLPLSDEAESSQIAFHYLELFYLAISPAPNIYQPHSARGISFQYTSNISGRISQSTCTCRSGRSGCNHVVLYT